MTSLIQNAGVVAGSALMAIAVSLPTPSANPSPHTNSSAIHTSQLEARLADHLKDAVAMFHIGQKPIEYNLAAKGTGQVQTWGHQQSVQFNQG